MNNNLKETASTVQQSLLIKRVTVIHLMQSNPIHGWIQSMSDSSPSEDLRPQLVVARLRPASTTSARISDNRQI